MPINFNIAVLNYAGELGMLNAADLSKILKWNVQNGIKCFRLSNIRIF